MKHEERWEEMQSDCLACILKKLSLEDLTLSIPFVCKSWHKASLNPLCWQILDFRHLDFMPWRKSAKRFELHFPGAPLSFSPFLRFAVSRSCGLLLELHFPRLLQVSLTDLVYVSNECPRLKILVLRSLRLEDQLRLPNIIGKWKELEHLEMASNPRSFPDIAKEISLNCDKFSGLKMSGLRKEDAFAITKYLPKLKYLNLSRSYMPKETLLLIMNSCKEIEILVVTHCVGFKIDKDIQEKASSIKIFGHGGSKLVDDSDYGGNDDLPAYMCCEEYLIM